MTEDAERLVVVEEEHEGPDVTKVNEFTSNYWSYRPMVRREVEAGAGGGFSMDLDI